MNRSLKQDWNRNYYDYHLSPGLSLNCLTNLFMFRGGVGRGFVAGYAGLAMILIAILVILMCCGCWCYELVYKRRRRLSLEETLGSEQMLREESPKFLKLLASKENARRTSCTNSISECPTGFPIIKKCEVMYSGAVCPYQAQSSLSMHH